MDEFEAPLRRLMLLLRLLPVGAPFDCALLDSSFTVLLLMLATVLLRCCPAEPLASGSDPACPFIIVLLVVLTRCRVSPFCLVLLFTYAPTPEEGTPSGFLPWPLVLKLAVIARLGDC